MIIIIIMQYVSASPKVCIYVNFPSAINGQFNNCWATSPNSGEIFRALITKLFIERFINDHWENLWI